MTNSYTKPTTPTTYNGIQTSSNREDPTASASTADVTDKASPQHESNDRYESAPTPFMRDGRPVWPYRSYMSGGVHIQAYDLRINKNLPKKPIKPYTTIKTEREAHDLLGCSDPPPLVGQFETMRTLGRLEEVLAEERSLSGFERYESHISRLRHKTTDSIERFSSWLMRCKDRWKARKEERRERVMTLASDATDLELLSRQGRRSTL